MKLYVATTDHSARFIFSNSRQPQPIPSQLVQLARKATTSVHASTALKQLSPPLNLCVVQRYLNSQRYRRQLIWSPTVSPEADPFHGWDDDDDEEEQQKEDGKTIQFLTTQQRKRRIGRYYPIRTSDYVKTNLPPHPPLLSVQKHRLPLRSDVGFPRATMEEVHKKQEEIQREAMWEEACPRLAVLVSARDVGEFCHLRKILDKQGAVAAMAAQKDRKIMEGSTTITGSYGVQVRHFDDVVMGDGPVSKKRKPNPASVFAPPLEAVPAGRGWKPRPVSDRPPGLRYVLVDPIKVSFDSVGDVEPLVCTLALYCVKGWCKISEDFVFPAGEWGDELNVKDTINASAFDVEVNSPLSEPSTTGMMSPLSNTTAKSGDHSGWKQWRQKALFSYDPLAFVTSQCLEDGVTSAKLAGQGGHEDLCLVLQVFKVAHEGALIPYLSENNTKHTTSLKQLSRRFGSSKRHSLDEVETCRSRAWSVFSNFGTQFLTPICFGVMPVFDRVDWEQDDGVCPGHRWPGEGCTQTADFYAFPPQAESHDTFIERLAFVRSQEVLNRAVHTYNENQSTPDVSPTKLPASLRLNNQQRHIPLMMPNKSKGFLQRSSSKSSLFEKSLEGGEGHTTTSFYETPFRLTGVATVVTTSLGSDFTKAVQPTVPESSTLNVPSQTLTPIPFAPSSKERKMVVPVTEERASRPVKLLVDVMGDGAVASRNKHPSNEKGNPLLKRSDRSPIVRLSRSRQPAGYADSADIREILYLPPTDSPSNCESSSLLTSDMNLMFLYPKVLTLAENMDNKENMKFHSGASKLYSVRIRLMKEDTQQSSDSSSKVLDAIYNPAPGGQMLLKALYTKSHQ